MENATAERERKIALAWHRGRMQIIGYTFRAERNYFWSDITYLPFCSLRAQACRAHATVVGFQRAIWS